jgi:RNA polymerase sigma-70 factor (ECF subfamily)
MSLCAQSVFVLSWAAVGGQPTVGRANFINGVNEPINQQDEVDPDLELFQRMAARDRAAFAEFYDRHSTRLYSLAVKIVNDATEAQDVLQESFLQIWEKAGQFDPKLGRPVYWAVVLVRNKAVDRVRASQRRCRLTESAGAEAALAMELAGSANETVHGQEKAGLIRSALVELPAEQRQAIELAFFSGLTQNEISTKLSQPLGTIKARIRRGLLKLRDQLEGVL